MVIGRHHRLRRATSVVNLVAAAGIAAARKGSEPLVEHRRKVYGADVAVLGAHGSLFQFYGAVGERVNISTIRLKMA
jgi:hypothetical protein